jgi:hypothetical protein
MKDQPRAVEVLYAKQYTDWMVKTGGYAKDMTMRDHFAALAMQALLRDDDVIEIWRGIPADAYEMADAMLKERIK